jgi:hypothetical protein
MGEGEAVRRPNERLSQRRLALDLRTKIDAGRLEEAARLLLEHPRGRRSRHVTHNLGARRRATMVKWLRRARSFGG